MPQLKWPDVGYSFRSLRFSPGRPCDIHGGQSGIGTGFSPSFYNFPPLIIIPPLLHTHLSPLFEACDSPDQAAQHHILGLQVGGFISVPALGWAVSADRIF
jgi:hypothetical protein